MFLSCSLSIGLMDSPSVYLSVCLSVYLSFFLPVSRQMLYIGF